MDTENDSRPRSYEFRDEWNAVSPLLRLAFGLDKSWSSDGSCRSYPKGHNVDGSTWWHGETHTRRNTAPHRATLEGEKAQAALLICQGCPVQYECAEYAVRGVMTAGIWGMSSLHRELLQKMNPDAAVVLIDGARAKAVPVEVFLRTSLHT